MYLVPEQWHVKGVQAPNNDFASSISKWEGGGGGGGGGGGVESRITLYCIVLPYDWLHVFFVSVSDDHSRVVLSLQDNTPGSDYINASYVDVR